MRHSFVLVQWHGESSIRAASEVKLITDRETGQSSGFGFATMGNGEG
jgi:hypothetical protein